MSELYVCEWLTSRPGRSKLEGKKSSAPTKHETGWAPKPVSETLSCSLLSYRLRNPTSQGNLGNEVNHPNHKNGNDDNHKINGNFSIHGKHRDTGNLGTKMLKKEGR